MLHFSEAELCCAGKSPKNVKYIPGNTPHVILDKSAQSKKSIDIVLESGIL